MIFVGIDIGKYQHCAGAINDQGQIVAKPQNVPQTLEGLDRLQTRLLGLGSTDEVIIGMEATGHYGKILWHFLTSLGWRVDVFNPLLTAACARAKIRGRKTDADDCIIIAKVVRDGDYTPIQVPSPELQELKTLCRQRCFVVHESCNAKRRLGALTDQVFPEFCKLFSDPYGKSALTILEEFPSARSLAQAHLKHLHSLVKTASHGRFGKDKAKELRQAAQNSTALTIDDNGSEATIAMMVQQLRFFKGQLQTIEAQITTLFDGIDHLLKSIPGLGSVLPPVILAEFGDVNRFSGRRAANKMLAYAGLDPRIRQSGQWNGKTKMSKRGSPTLRTALFQASFAVSIHCPAFKTIYDRQRQRNKHHAVALSHVARKLLGVIHAMMRDHVPFDPSKMGENMT